MPKHKGIESEQDAAASSLGPEIRAQSTQRGARSLVEEDVRGPLRCARCLLESSVLLWAGVLWIGAMPGMPCWAQNFEQRGYFETDLTLYPQTAPNDSSHAVADTLFRYEASYKAASWLTLFGSFDARTDTHRDVQRSWRLDLEDRSLQRPAFSLRRLSVMAHKGIVTFEVGRQFIRWGKADILNPTDRFAPKDFLTVVDTDFLAVPAARLTVESGSNTYDFVWQPRFTPSRTPLLNQRWTVFPESTAGIPVYDLGSRYPDGSQGGVRWNHVGRGYEFSLSYFDGYNYLPLLDATVSLQPLSAQDAAASSFGSETWSPRSVVRELVESVGIQRYYPRLRLYGADAAVPLKWFTVKTEEAWFGSPDGQAEEYALYVMELEREVGEWSFVAGYAGEVVTASKPNLLQFAPDRGFARTFLGHANYNLGPTRSIGVETAIRQNGKGLWLQCEYSQSLGQHWRATAGFTWIHGNPSDFLGQYRRNSHALLALRYSF